VGTVRQEPTLQMALQSDIAVDFVDRHLILHCRKQAIFDEEISGPRDKSSTATC
jgi:hypothetical protein